MNYKTTIIAKAEIVKPNTEAYKAMAATIKEKYGFELKPQIDLTYVRSCLVSCGQTVGINENDDIFTREEVWKARQSPILKPMNWQHHDKDIVGVIYSVQAIDLDGNILDISSDKVPNKDFDIWIESVIFKLVQAEKCAEIAKLHEKAELFVSMEAWFDNYDYGAFLQDKVLAKIIKRNEQTGFLDKSLRAAGGNGTYYFTDSDQEMNLGRVLRGITFGGCGFVYRPANKRSKIDEIKSDLSVSSKMADDYLIKDFLKSQSIDFLKEMHPMNTVGSNTTEVEVAVDRVLEKRDREQAKANEAKELKTRAETAETQVSELVSKQDELNTMLALKEQEKAELSKRLENYQTLITKLFEDSKTSGNAQDLAKIDTLKNDEAFAAKLNFLAQTRSELVASAKKVEELQGQLAKIESANRTQEVIALLGPHMSKEAVEVLAGQALTLSAEAYQNWKEEKELIVLELGKGKEAKPEEKGKKLSMKDLLESRKNSKSGDLVNPPTGGGINSGVSPEMLRTPRFKIAGSAAGNDPLENVTVEEGFNFAGASLGEDEEEVNAFKTLASEMYNIINKNKEE